MMRKFPRAGAFPQAAGFKQQLRKTFRVLPDSLHVRTRLVRHERRGSCRRFDPDAPVRFAGAGRSRNQVWRSWGDVAFTFCKRAGRSSVTAGKVPDRCPFESGDGSVRPVGRGFGQDPRHRARGRPVPPPQRESQARTEAAQGARAGACRQRHRARRSPNETARQGAWRLLTPENLVVPDIVAGHAQACAAFSGANRNPG